MKAKLNIHLFRQVGWDSGSLTPLASVMHRFAEPGKYRGVVRSNEATVGSFELVSDPGAPTVHTDIDLEGVLQSHYAGRDHVVQRFVVHPGQQTQFFVSRGAGGFSVAVWRSDDKEKTAAFDSRELRQNDRFLVRPIQSGIYSITAGSATGRLTVAERKARKEQPLSVEPRIVECTEKGLHPANVTADFLQPVFFLIETPSRITVKRQQPAEDESKKSSPSRDERSKR